MPQRVAGDPALVKLWVQTITGQEQDAGKAGAVLDAAAWRERRSRVIDSPLGADLEPGAGAASDWHDEMAAAFEVSGAPEAALWHLDRLLAVRPKDWSLHARRAGVWHRSSRSAEARQAHDALGHCQARLGRFTEASDHFTRAVALAPDHIGYQLSHLLTRLVSATEEPIHECTSRLAASPRLFLWPNSATGGRDRRGATPGRWRARRSIAPSAFGRWIEMGHSRPSM
jgi:hypothetical protein